MFPERRARYESNASRDQRSATPQKSSFGRGPLWAACAVVAAALTLIANPTANSVASTAESPRSGKVSQVSAAILNADGSETIIGSAQVSAGLAAGKKCKKVTVEIAGKSKKICRKDVSKLAAEILDSNYNYLSVIDGKPARWDRCNPIRYALNTSSMTGEEEKIVRQVMRVLSKQSGYAFVDAGITNFVPFADANWHQKLVDSEEKTQLFIAFSDETTVPKLAGEAVGIGGPVTLSDNVGGDPEIVYAGVVMEKGDALRREFTNGTTLAVGLLHELGHAMNLGHVSRVSELMFPQTIPQMKTKYGKGDRAGFRSLASKPCFPPNAAG
jgi:hypothetical protein